MPLYTGRLPISAELIIESEGSVSLKRILTSWLKFLFWTCRKKRVSFQNSDFGFHISLFEAVLCTVVGEDFGLSKVIVWVHDRLRLSFLKIVLPRKIYQGRHHEIQSGNTFEESMDYIRHGEIQGRSLVFFRAHCPCILPRLT